MLSSSENMLDAVPLLMLTDCLETCRNNATCSSVNYETGLCVLFSTSADKLQGKFLSSFNEEFKMCEESLEGFGSLWISKTYVTFFTRVNDKIAIPGIYNLRSEGLFKTTTL